MQDIIGRGWPFPTKLTPGGKLALVGGDEKIRQSIWSILSTAPGERLMRPGFGCGIHDLVFQPNTAVFRTQVRENVLASLLRWEPRIDILDVRVETQPQARNYLLILIDYRIRTTNTVFNLVYPLFFDEGIG